MWVADLLALASLALSVPQTVPPASSPSGDSTVPSSQQPQRSDQDIIVTGMTPKALRSYIHEASGNYVGEQVPRWGVSICLKVEGPAPKQSEYMVQRISAIAKAAGAPPVRTDGCDPSVVITVSSDADELTAELLRRFPRLGFDLSSGILDLRRVKAMLRETRPVRWFANTSWFNPIVPIAGEMQTQNISAMPQTSASRLNPPRQRYFRQMQILVDGKSQGPVNLRQLSDYCAMVALANPLMDGDFPDGSILSLYQHDGDTAPAGLMPVDLNYLRALYSTTIRYYASTNITNIQRRRIREKLEHLSGIPERSQEDADGS